MGAEDGVAPASTSPRQGGVLNASEAPIQTTKDYLNQGPWVPFRMSIEISAGSAKHWNRSREVSCFIQALKDWPDSEGLVPRASRQNTTVRKPNIVGCEKGSLVKK